MGRKEQVRGGGQLVERERVERERVERERVERKRVKRERVERERVIALLFARKTPYSFHIVRVTCE